MKKLCLVVLLFLVLAVPVLALDAWVRLDIPALDHGTIPARVPVEYVVTAFTTKPWSEMVVYLRDLNSNVSMQSHIDNATSGWQQWRRNMVIEAGQYEMSVVGRIGGLQFTHRLYMRAI